MTSVVQPSTVTEGDNVSLTCVSGCPTPVDIFWFRDGQLVKSPVFQARREDAGGYYCAVLGQETARSASVPLNVQCKYMNNTFRHKNLQSSTYYLTFSTQSSFSPSSFIYIFFLCQFNQQLATVNACISISITMEILCETVSTIKFLLYLNIEK